MNSALHFNKGFRASSLKEKHYYYTVKVKGKERLFNSLSATQIQEKEEELEYQRKQEKETYDPKIGLTLGYSVKRSEENTVSEKKTTGMRFQVSNRSLWITYSFTYST